MADEAHRTAGDREKEPWFDDDDFDVADLDDEDYVEINLREPSEAAGRLVLLISLARRGFLEQQVEDDADSPETERFDLYHWLSEEKLTNWADPHELATLETPVGKLSDEDAIEATWSIEAATALAWALGKISELPPFDQAADAARVIDVLPAPWSRTTEFRNAATLRDEVEIARARELAEIWAYRADMYWWQKSARDDAQRQPVDQMSAEELDASIAQTAAEAHAAGLLPPPVDNDFPTQFGPYRQLSPDMVEELQLIASHRLQALNWLCGLVDDLT